MLLVFHRPVVCVFDWLGCWFWFAVMLVVFLLGLLGVGRLTCLGFWVVYFG